MDGEARGLSSSEARAELQGAMSKRDAMEAEAEAIESELNSPGEGGLAGPGLSGPLVDAEGYPRADIDVYRARQLRGTHARLRTDHSLLMKRIETLLPLALARDDADKAGSSEAATVVAPLAAPLATAAPFSRVAEVRSGSPASSAGLRVGDGVVRFGDVSAMADIKRWVLTHVNEAFDVHVVRDGARVAVSLTPTAWRGQGLLGCLLTPLAAAAGGPE